MNKPNLCYLMNKWTNKITHEITIKISKEKLGTSTISIQFLLCYINRCKNNTYEKETRLEGKENKWIAF